MNTETYLNHPTFGLLYQLCQLENNQELFTTLYAQRLFFLVQNTSEGIVFEPITRSDARMMIESRLRQLRRMGKSNEIQNLQTIYKQTF